MKYCFLLIASFALQISHAQWVNKSISTMEEINMVHFPTNSTGYAVANKGFIFKTTNGGNSWTSFKISIPLDLKDVAFYDSSLGYIIGQNSLIYKTTDGGNSWLPAVALDGAVDLTSIALKDSSRIEVVGTRGKTYSYTNGVWTNSRFTTKHDLHKVIITSYGKSIAVGDSGSIYIKEKDSSSYIKYANHKSSIPLYSVQEVGNKLFASGGWYDDTLKKFTSQHLVSHDSGKIFIPLSINMENRILFHHWHNADTSYFIGNGSGIWASYDGMATANRIFIGTNNTLNFLNFKSPTEIYAGGVAGTLWASKAGPGWTTGIKKLAVEHSIYPNPCTDYLEIKDVSNYKSISLLNTDGRLLKQFPTSSHRLSLQDIASGMHFLKLETFKGETAYKKILILGE